MDKGLNIIQNSNSNNKKNRIISCQQSNRAISQTLYDSLNLSPTEKAELNNALLSHNIFDQHGNQLKTSIDQQCSWDYASRLQTTSTLSTTDLEIQEFNIYARTGQRNRKVEESKTSEGQTIQITEALYVGNLEYRTIWKGNDLIYDGEIVIEKMSGQQVEPFEQYSTLRIRQGHKQVAQKKQYQYAEGSPVNQKGEFYTLDNNIDSCELTITGQGILESYESYAPYGETAISYGKTTQQPYKYSGQEKDQSGLYYYGYRSFDPETFRWISPDPAGLHGSGLNWYAMVGGNPIRYRDMYGLGWISNISNMVLAGLAVNTFFKSWTGIQNYFGKPGYYERLSNDAAIRLQLFKDINEHYVTCKISDHTYNMPDTEGDYDTEYEKIQKIQNYIEEITLRSMHNSTAFHEMLTTIIDVNSKYPSVFELHNGHMQELKQIGPLKISAYQLTFQLKIKYVVEDGIDFINFTGFHFLLYAAHSAAVIAVGFYQTGDSGKRLKRISRKKKIKNKLKQGLKEIKSISASGDIGYIALYNSHEAVYDLSVYAKRKARQAANALAHSAPQQSATFHTYDDVNNNNNNNNNNPIATGTGFKFKTSMSPGQAVAHLSSMGYSFTGSYDSNNHPFYSGTYNGVSGRVSLGMHNSKRQGKLTASSARKLNNHFGFR